MDFLQIREEYKLAYHRWEQCSNHLCTLLDCNFADLEQCLLESGHRYAELVHQYTKLGIALDRASDRWDTAQMLQARATFAANQLNRDFQLIEC